jgi:hypothetical protein
VPAHAISDGEERHVSQVAVFVAGTPMTSVSERVPRQLYALSAARQGDGVANTAAAESGHEGSKS